MKTDKEHQMKKHGFGLCNLSNKKYPSYAQVYGQMLRLAEAQHKRPNLTRTQKWAWAVFNFLKKQNTTYKDFTQVMNIILRWIRTPVEFMPVVTTGMDLVNKWERILSAIEREKKTHVDISAVVSELCLHAKRLSNTPFVVTVEKNNETCQTVSSVADAITAANRFCAQVVPSLLVETMVARMTNGHESQWDYYLWMEVVNLVGKTDALRLSMEIPVLKSF